MADCALGERFLPFARAFGRPACSFVDGGPLTGGRLGPIGRRVATIAGFPAAGDAHAEERRCLAGAAARRGTTTTATAERFVPGLRQGQGVLFSGRAFGVEVDFTRGDPRREGQRAHHEKDEGANDYHRPVESPAVAARIHPKGQGKIAMAETLDERPSRAAGRCLVLLGLLAICFFAITSTPASAAAPTHKLIWGPADAAAFNTYADLGAGLYEITINWSRVAPTRPAEPTNPDDPAYQWTPAVEEAIRNAEVHGIQVVVEVSGAPSWANGGRPWRWAPRNPQTYADFVAAASKRWPQVHYWQIWGEPTRRANFMPLAKHVQGIDLTRAERRGPELYARILDAAYVALKAVNPENMVIGGNTFSGGDIRPLAFIKALRLPDGRPPRMDLFGQNPFGYRRPDLSKPALNPTSGIADFCDLDVLAHYLDLYLSRAGRNPQPLRLFLSEYFVPTDHSNFEFNYWVSRRTAGNWVAAALKITRDWHRIFTLGWFELYDEGPNSEGTEVNRGLLTWDHHPKPAYYAFKNG